MTDERPGLTDKIRWATLARLAALGLLAAAVWVLLALVIAGALLLVGLT